MPANDIKVQEAVIVHIFDEKSKLIHVACEHELWVAGGVNRSDSVTHCIIIISGSDGPYIIVEYGLGLSLVTGGRSGV